MFKSETEFAQAMLDGRRFRNAATGSEWRWNGQVFIVEGGTFYNFTTFDSVTEILPEPEPFKPKEGDEILVWWGTDERNVVKRKFVDMVNGYYVCCSKDSDYPVVWEFAKPLPEENPWHDIVPGEWPECKPDDVVEVEGEKGTFAGIASEWSWNKLTTSKRWRYAK